MAQVGTTSLLAGVVDVVAVGSVVAKSAVAKSMSPMADPGQAISTAEFKLQWPLLVCPAQTRANESQSKSKWVWSL